VEVLSFSEQPGDSQDNNTMQQIREAMINHNSGNNSQHRPKQGESPSTLPITSSCAGLWPEEPPSPLFDIELNID